jgi:CheY-like chemotaxis protein
MNFVVDKSFEERKIDWVRLDPSRLLQVLINLTTNAIKFTTAQDKRTITITLSAYTDPPSHLPDKCVDYIPARSKRDDITEGKDWGDGQPIYLHFSVSDTGKGLTESEKKLLFLRFSQANPKTHVRYGGSGLGLFISRELVELQGGEIGVSSESGAGSTFAFYVKARRSSGPSSTDGGSGENLLTPHGNTAALGRRSSGNKTLKTKSSNPATNNTGSESQDPGPALSFASGNLDYLRVLIVEDNLVNQRVLSKQLRNLGCTIHVANHGGECIDHLQKTKYWAGNEKDGTDLSIILMDLEMPVMDGLTCARKIREYQRTGEVTEHVPIIAV